MAKAVKIRKNIYWVGVQDWELRDFHGPIFPVQGGASYNAYLVIDDEVTLIDNVEHHFMDIMMERITSVLGDRKIDNIIINHVEPDHSSSFLALIEKYPDAKVYTSVAGVRGMKLHFFKEHPYIDVKTGVKICTGNYHFMFIEMPMIHWPDNMMCYLEEEKILFSNDVFGQHLVSSYLYDDQHSLYEVIDKAKEYYANIVMVYGDRVAKRLDDIANMNLEIELICTGHGVILRSYINEMIGMYKKWANFEAKPKVIIALDSMWGNSMKMARALAEGIMLSGVEVKIYPISKTSSSLLFTELLDTKGIIVGSGTYNNAMIPQVAGFLEHLSSMKLKGKLGMGFGSFGWARGVPDKIANRLSESGIECVIPAFSHNYVPTPEVLNQLEEIGLQFGTIVKERLGIER